MLALCSLMRLTALLALLAGADAVALTMKYFNARGAAEISRVLLAISGTEYSDHRYEIVTKEGGGGFSTPEFAADKESGALAANLDRAPVLLVGDQPVGQSKAMERYIATQAGLMGATPLEAALIDSVAEHVYAAAPYHPHASVRRAPFLSACAAAAQEGRAGRSGSKGLRHVQSRQVGRGEGGPEG